MGGRAALREAAPGERALFLRRGPCNGKDEGGRAAQRAGGDERPTRLVPLSLSCSPGPFPLSSPRARTLAMVPSFQVLLIPHPIPFLLSLPLRLSPLLASPARHPPCLRSSSASWKIPCFAPPCFSSKLPLFCRLPVLYGAFPLRTCAVGPLCHSGWYFAWVLRGPLLFCRQCQFLGSL